MQAALEAEITEFLGRDRYQRAAACDDARPGSRNGYREVTVKTTAGPVQLSRPKLRGTTEAFASRLFGCARDQDQRAGDAGDRLVRARPVGPRRRGRPGRGARATRPRSPSPPCRRSAGQIKDEYAGLGDAAAWTASRWTTCTWTPRFFRMHPGSPAEPVLAAWGITTDGKPAFIGLAPGSGESADAWQDFLHRPQRPRPALPAAGHQRRRARPDRRDRAGLPQGAASTVSHPPGEKCPGQGPGRDAGRDQGRLLGPVRHRGPDDQARPQARRARSITGSPRWPTGTPRPTRRR